MTSTWGVKVRVVTISVSGLRRLKVTRYQFLAPATAKTGIHFRFISYTTLVPEPRYMMVAVRCRYEARDPGDGGSKNAFFAFSRVFDNFEAPLLKISEYDFRFYGTKRRRISSPTTRCAITSESHRQISRYSESRASAVKNTRKSVKTRMSGQRYLENDMTDLQHLDTILFNVTNATTFAIMSYDKICTVVELSTRKL